MLSVFPHAKRFSCSASRKTPRFATSLVLSGVCHEEVALLTVPGRRSHDRVCSTSIGRRAAFWSHCILESHIAIAGPLPRPLERDPIASCRCHTGPVATAGNPGLCFTVTVTLAGRTGDFRSRHKKRRPGNERVPKASQCSLKSNVVTDAPRSGHLEFPTGSRTI